MFCRFFLSPIPADPAVGPCWFRSFRWRSSYQLALSRGGWCESRQCFGI